MCRLSKTSLHARRLMLKEYLGLCRYSLPAGSPLKVFMRRTYLFVFYLLIFSALFGLPGKAASQSATVVRVSPADVTLLPGESQTIEVWVDDVEALWGFQIDIQFDPAIIEVSNLTKGSMLSTINGEFEIVISDIDSDLGTIAFHMYQKRVDDQTPLPRDGSGVLFLFTIRAKDQLGETALTFDEITLSDRDSFEIPCSTQDGTVTITNEVTGSTVYLPLVMR